MNRSFLKYMIIALFLNSFFLSPVFSSPGLEEEIDLLSGKTAKKIENVGKKKIAVVDFSDLDGNVTELGRFLAEEFSASFSTVEEIISGNVGLIRSFGLKNKVDYLVLVKKTSRFKSNQEIPEVSDTIRADLTFQIRIISTKPLKVTKYKSISTMGAGFSNQDAERNAVEKMYREFEAILKENL